jgi:CheY-like chemotaxis protein
VQQAIRVLFVDDTPSCIKVGEGLLRVVSKKLAVTFEVVPASDGRQAVERFKTGLVAGRPFKLVFLDIMMPVLDGIQATQQIRSVHTSAAERPFIATVSAIATQDGPSRALNAGADMFVRKPLSLRTLENVCWSALSVLGEQTA